MSAPPPASPFELSGRFAGFFRDVFGKRRMVLRVEGDELFLKIPKDLRHELEDRLQPGQEIVVAGCVEDGRDRRVVTRVRMAGAAAECFTCPIRVCAKKDCWRSGGRELYRELERQIENAGLGDTVKLKAVGCMDHCKHGPNVEAGGCDFRRCSPHDAKNILRQITALSDPREARNFGLEPARLVP